MHTTQYRLKKCELFLFLFTCSIFQDTHLNISHLFFIDSQFLSLSNSWDVSISLFPKLFIYSFHLLLDLRHPNLPSLSTFFPLSSLPYWLLGFDISSFLSLSSLHLPLWIKNQPHPSHFPLSPLRCEIKCLLVIVIGLPLTISNF